MRNRILLCYLDRIMQRYTTLVLFFVAGLFSFGQSFYDAGPTKDPRAVFEAIAPYYDYMDANLKPWHMKVDYQIDDEKGSPAESGVFEYWWVSPKVYRSTWTRGQSTHSDWHTADGRHYTQTIGDPLGIYEHWLRTALLSPLPSADDLNPGKDILVDHSIASANSHSRCFMVVPSEVTAPVARTLPFGLYPEYCVNKARPLLLGFYRFGTIMVRCVIFTQMQGKSMPREVYIIEGSREILSAKVEPVDALNPADPALIPPDKAILVKVERSGISSDAESKLLVKKVAPAYPEDAKSARIHGKVVLQTTIGPDGRVEDVRLVSAPSPSLALSAFHAVSQWEYKPHHDGGEAVTVESTVEVEF